MTDGRVPDDPTRLRECLTALAKTAGADVYRVELTFRADSAHIFLTSSNEASETEIGKLLWSHLRPIAEEALQPNAKLTALRAEIVALRATGQKLANLAFNWKQEASVVGELIGAERRTELAELQREWDAIPRVEAKP